MRVAIISDIHGNCVALDAALGDIDEASVDKIVCLGDTIQGGAEPVETVERLRGLNFPVVMGNADAWLLNEEADSAEPTTDVQREVRRWTLSRLSSQDLEFLRGYRPTVELELDETKRLLCFHGSPDSYDTVLLPDSPNDTWEKALGKHSAAVMTGGHTHIQQLRRVGAGLFFNPGSIGMVYDAHLSKDRFHADPWAEYAILSYDMGRLGIEFRRVPYELEKLIRTVRASGRPYADRMISDYTGR